MYQVSTVHLNADVTRADPDVDVIDRGEFSSGELVLLLERFQALNLIEPHAAGPYIELLSSSGKFRIRTSQGKLFFHDAHDTSEACTELTPPEIIIQLERYVVTVAPFVLTPLVVAPPEPVDRPKGGSAPRRGLAVAILAAVLLLIAYTVYSISRSESVDRPPEAMLLTDAKEISARRAEIAGTYATGALTGDRVITIQPDGRLEYSEVGRTSKASRISDTSQVGRQKGKICLVAGDGSLIQVVNIDTLVYCRDTYRRKP